MSQTDNVEDARSEQPRSPNASRPIIVGRGSELGLLTDLADRSVEIGAHFAIVAGEAGIGKSTLIDHFANQLVDARWAVHSGHCIEYAERTLAFGPIVAIIRSIVAAADERGGADAVADLVGHHRADLAALLPELRDDTVAGASLSGDVDRLIDAISRVLIRAADDRPMAIVIEDIHWGDAATRDLIASLVHSLDSARILMLISERTDAMRRDNALHIWTAELQRFANVSTIRLSGLSEQALADQAANILGETVDPSEVAALAARTGGNAYFATELLLARRAGTASLPSSLADFLTSRVQRLDGDEQAVLRALAVAGRALHHRALTDIVPSLDVAAVTRRLVDAEILVAAGSDIDFRHALLREAILPDVLPFEAEDLHRRLAHVVAANLGPNPSPADLATLAAHWTAAGERERALTADVSAAQAAAGVAAYESAIEFSRRALDAWTSVTEPEALTGTTRDELTVLTSEWLVASNQPAAASALLADAAAVWGGELPAGRRALLLAKRAPILFEMGRPDEAAQLIEQAVALVGDEVSAEAAQVHHRAAKLATLSGSIHPALQAAKRAIEIAESTGPEITLVEAMITKALGVGVTESVEDAIELVRTARERAMAGNMVFQVAHSYRTEMTVINHGRGRTEECQQVLREGLAYAERHCGPSVRLDLQHSLALGLVEAGQLNEARPIIDDALATPATGLRRLQVLHAAALHRVLVGDLDEAGQLLGTAAELSGRFHSAQETGFQRRIEAELARRQGRLDDAIELIDEALALQLGSDNISFTRESILEKCRIVRQLDGVDHERAVALGRTLSPHVERMANADPTSAALSGLMNLELHMIDGTATAMEATAVVDRLSVFGLGAEILQASLAHAELVAIEARDREDIVDVLKDLRVMGATSGMQWLIEGADRITEHSGLAIDLTEGSSDAAEPPRKADAASAVRHGLTDRELEVLGLLAQGLTNKEIGAELFVSHRTISTHVSNLLAKLHLKNRSEAAAAYHRLGFASSDA